MMDSKQLAALIGPAMVAVGATEASKMDVFSTQMAPVVYLNGTILFVVGLAIVRAHNLWTWRWPVIVTLSGWTALIGGLWRMAAPEAPQATDDVGAYALLAAIVVIGTVLSFMAYGPKAFSAKKASDV